MKNNRHAAVIPSLLVCMTALLVAPVLRAEVDAERVVADPPLLEFQRRAPKLAPAAPLARGRGVAAEAAAAPSDGSLDLNVIYTDGKIWNPATQRFDAVHLRSYQGTRVNPAAPFVSPMLEVRPGDTIRVSLNNRLPADPSCTQTGGNVNTPHCFNGTNLHTHGLWVNPAGNGDNVLLSINPGVSFQYEYNVPADHPAGTFWYHTHRHGSTALQVSSGMAGALIIRGRRLPTPTVSGDIDTLLQSAAPDLRFKERVLVMQQIQYACRDAQGKVKTNPDGTYRCDPGDVGGIEGYDQFGPGSWPASGRHTSINGVVMPRFEGAVAGQVERWRVIHGGVRDTIALQFMKLKPGAASPDGLGQGEQAKFIADNCTGKALPQHLIAADGLTAAAAIKTDETVFQPGYRWDALMVFPEPGLYCVINGTVPPAGRVGQSTASPRLMGMVRVQPGRKVGPDITAYLIGELSRAATLNMPADVRTQVIADLRDGLKFSRFLPHASIADKEVTGTQSLLFNIDVNVTPIQFQVNGKPFDPSRIDRTLTLGGVDEWTLQSNFVSHPFHIHVNPFQIVKILDPTGKDVSAPGAVDDAGGTVDPQYPGLKGVWKDTLWVKNIAPSGGPSGQYTLIVRTRYERYIGSYVLHCHILDHEDQGMMQIVEVALPDGAGGTSAGHSH